MGCVKKTGQDSHDKTRAVCIRVETTAGHADTHPAAVSLGGDLTIPADAVGIVLFAHGSGSSRHSPRNQLVARVIQAAGIGTFLFDLLTKEEEAEDEVTGRLRFDIGLLARRLVEASNWIANQ